MKTGRSRRNRLKISNLLRSRMNFVPCAKPDPGQQSIFPPVSLQIGHVLSDNLMHDGRQG